MEVIIVIMIISILSVTARAVNKENIILWYLYRLFWLPTFITIRILGKLSIWAFIIATKSPLIPGFFNWVSKIATRYFFSWVADIIEERGVKMPKIFAVKPGEIRKVTLPSESDVKVEDRTVFHITSPDVREMAEIQNNLYAVTGIGKTRKEQFRTGEQQVLLLRKGLKGWENFCDADGNEVKFTDPSTASSAKDRERIEFENINRIPEAIRGELVDLIRGEANVESD